MYIHSNKIMVTLYLLPNITNLVDDRPTKEILKITALLLVIVKFYQIILPRSSTIASKITTTWLYMIINSWISDNTMNTFGLLMRLYVSEYSRFGGVKEILLIINIIMYLWISIRHYIWDNYIPNYNWQDPFYHRQNVHIGSYGNNNKLVSSH